MSWGSFFFFFLSLRDSLLFYGSHRLGNLFQVTDERINSRLTSAGDPGPEYTPKTRLSTVTGVSVDVPFNSRSCPSPSSAIPVSPHTHINFPLSRPSSVISQDLGTSVRRPSGSGGHSWTQPISRRGARGQYTDGQT